MIYIVGSGPAGIASARALLTRGLEVTMLDAGLDLEPERAEVVRRLGSLPPERWSNSDRDYLRDGPAPTVRGILRKGIYGSTYPYRPLGDTPLVEESADVGAVPSYARGGLSNVWGAGVLPYAEDEFANWPVSRADLAPHFEAVLRMLPLAGAPDRLERRFPLYTEDLGPLDLSQQASAFLGDLEGRGNELEQAGFAFGRSRLAVRTRPAGADAGCVYCGLCLHGCPYRLIYSTAATLDTFIAEEPRFHYVPGVVVHRVREAGTTVTIEGTDGTGMPRSFVGTRVFLACGTLSTTRVVLESMRAYETPVRFKDSQYFLVPVLRRAAVSDVESESLHTMCQLFLRWQPPFAARATHLSVYTYNGFYRQAIERMLGPTSLLIGTLLPPVLSRLLIIQGHLPCNLSTSITARLVRERHDGPAKLRLSAADTSRSADALKEVGRELVRVQRLMRAVVVKPLIRTGKPGSGFYTGGSLPMSRTPRRFETDVLGRPSRFERTHVVDASVFPSIAGTPITLTVMANAHRIASAADWPSNTVVPGH